MDNLVFWAGYLTIDFSNATALFDIPIVERTAFGWYFADCMGGVNALAVCAIPLIFSFDGTCLQAYLLLIQARFVFNIYALATRLVPF